MPGEQLPPVVATMEGDDSEFLAMLDRDVAALRAAAGEIDGLLAGLDLGAALADSMRGANLGSINVDELAQGLSEGLAGVGNALGQDVGTQLTDAVRTEGVQAGAALAEGVAEGASGAGDSIGQDLTAGLTGEASNAGARAGESLSESLTGAVAGVGQDVAAQVDAGVGSLPGRFASVGAAAGHAMTAGLEGALLGLAGAAMGAAGALGGVGAAIEARLADVLIQAGQSAGPQLLAGISAGASGGAVQVASAVGTALEASLGDVLTEAGGPAGDSLMAGVRAGASSGAPSVAVAIAEALQAPLDDQMLLAGQSAGDAFNQGLGQSAAGSSEGGAGGSAIVQEFEQSESEVERQAEQLGRTAKLSFAQGWQTRNGVIPFGGQMEPDELINMGRQQDVFVPDMSGSQNAWILASKVGARQAADEAWNAYGQELAGLVIAPERFLALTDTGIAEWQHEVAIQAAASGEGFVSAFADAMTIGMAGINWDALTSAQATALGNAMRGIVQQAAPEAETEMQTLGQTSAAALSVGLAAQQNAGPGLAETVTEGLAEVPQLAAEQGGAAGGMFARAFASVKTSMADSFRAEFTDDPTWQAQMEQVRQLGQDAQAYFSSVAEGLHAEFADDPVWQARMDEARQLRADIAAGLRGAYGAISDAAAAALDRVQGAFGAIGDFGSAMVAREKEALAALGDLGPAMLERAREVFGAMSEYAAENADTIRGRLAGAFTDSVSAFAASVSAIGESVRLVFAGAPDAAAEAGAAAGAAFDQALAEGIAQSSPAALAVVQDLESQISAALAAGEDELAQSLMSRLGAIQAAAAQALDIAGPLEAEAAALGPVEGQLDAVFEAIWQHGTFMSSQLAGAMTNALAGITADTSGFTTAELAQWDAFFTTLEERGTAAAAQLAMSMGSLQGKDLVASGLGTTGIPFKQVGADAEGLAGDLGNVEKAASGAAGAFGGMSALMYGPAGMALFMLQPLLSSLPGLFSSSAASAADFTQVIQQDSGAVGDNTAATIQQTLAKSNLSAISQQLGISQAQLIEYAAGESSVQQQVTDAYNQQVAALNKAADARSNLTTKEHAGTSGPDTQVLNLEQQKQALDQVTAAVQQAIQQDAANSAALLAAEQTTQIYTAAVSALGQAQLLQVQQTKMSDEATAQFGSQVLFAESSVSFMNAAMGAAVATARESALTNAYASVALLGLGTSQSELNAQLSAGEAAYTEATGAAGAYNTVLSSLNGTTNTLLGSEAAYTTALTGLTTAVKTNGDSLDVNTAKGAANITAITGIATAAQAASVAVYQNDEANGKASQAYQDASTKLQQEKDAFEQAAEKAGMQKGAVQQLADELFKLPPSVTVGANVQPALDAAYGVVDRINTMVGTITVTESANGSTMGNIHGMTAARAAGGPVEAGQIYHVNEQGAEGYFVPPADGFIIPHDEMNAIASGGGTAGPSWVSPGGGVEQNSQLTVHVYLDGREIAVQTRSDAQWYKNHNGTTGYS